MSRPVRVLQIIDSLVRAGAEQSLATLAPHLVERDVDLHVAYLVERDGLRAEIERHGIPVISLDSPAPSRRRWLQSTVELIDDLRPDVVHTTLFEADLAGRRASARRRLPCISSLVTTAYGRTESGVDGVRRLKLRAAQAADVATARLVTRFHAVTDHVASVMSRRLLVPRTRIDVIPRGRDARVLGRRSLERRAAVRSRLGLPDEVPVVLAVGRHEPPKGLDVLLRAVPTLSVGHAELRVLVAGREGRATATLREIARGLQLEQTVTFLGMRDDVADLLVAADAFAFPSLWEGAGGTLLEAMALECPIVTSELPTLLETVDRSTALLVPPGQPEPLAHALAAALGDRSGSRLRARAARQRFSDCFTVESSALRMTHLYRAVAHAATT